MDTLKIKNKITNWLVFRNTNIDTNSQLLNKVNGSFFSILNYKKEILKSFNKIFQGCEIHLLKKDKKDKKFRKPYTELNLSLTDRYGYSLKTDLSVNFMNSNYNLYSISNIIENGNKIKNLIKNKALELLEIQKNMKLSKEINNEFKDLLMSTLNSEQNKFLINYFEEKENKSNVKIIKLTLESKSDFEMKLNFFNAVLLDNSNVFIPSSVKIFLNEIKLYFNPDTKNLSLFLSIDNIEIGNSAIYSYNMLNEITGKLNEEKDKKLIFENKSIVDLDIPEIAFSKYY